MLQHLLMEYVNSLNNFSTIKTINTMKILKLTLGLMLTVIIASAQTTWSFIKLIPT